MKNALKMLLLALLAVCMVAMLASCGGETETTTKDDETTTVPGGSGDDGLGQFPGTVPDDPSTGGKPGDDVTDNVTLPGNDDPSDPGVADPGFS